MDWATFWAIFLPIFTSGHPAARDHSERFFPVEAATDIEIMLHLLFSFPQKVI
jgi:hypothetical protein